MKSSRPFPETLKALMDLEGLSQRELTERLKRHGFGRAHSVLHRIYVGDGEPSPELMEGLGRVFKVSPEMFAEYRLAEARRHFEPSEVGWDAAMTNLDTFEQAPSKPLRRHSPAAHLRDQDDGGDPSASA